MGQTCVECGHPHPEHLLPYKSYTGNVIKLLSCKQCHLPLDRYSEYQPLLKAIDLTLFRPSIYRHYLLNVTPTDQWRLLRRLVLGICPLYVMLSSWAAQSRVHSCRDGVTAPTASLPSGFSRSVESSLQLPLLLLLTVMVRSLLSTVAFILTLASLHTPRLTALLAALLASCPELLYTVMAVYSYDVYFTYGVSAAVAISRLVACTVLIHDGRAAAAAAEGRSSKLVHWQSVLASLFIVTISTAAGTLSGSAILQQHMRVTSSHGIEPFSWQQAMLTVI